MRIVFMGTAEFAVPSLYRLIMAGHDVALVVTQPDRPRGRGKRVASSPVKLLAEEFGVRLFQPERIKDEESIKTIKSYDPDLIVVVAYGQILPSKLLYHPPFGCVNLHGSLLPRYRGAAPIQRAIMAGERVVGVTTMYMNESMDGGDIILQRSVEISDDATFGEVYQELSEIGGDLLLETVDQIGWGTAPRIPQDDSRATYAPVIRAEDEVIDWRREAREISNQIRALNPQPGASTTLDGVRLKFFRSRVLEDEADALPGQVVQVIDEEGFIVQTGKGQLVILEVQREGKKRLPASEFIKGYRVTPGLILGCTRQG
ncbi:MAG: methionyl-tRNA formyltransferase [Syntrophothermus sp.]|uniref:methionyl-tRNA formyltransferase n=1 Tax=Syntrophothermus sp. TaxID=2736299 RepID=UPI0025805080|nr:methionyl-tRNA formyltransferase [Syntrophothermus sp.]NSW82240.1 methionyl-tRNA formyltransferase [Syntrophothermus sp.]